ncbi:MAG TPA: hypothetical protein VIB79_27985 [Candidatus Binatia bacterium]|jgi:hypothetical protein
MPLFNRLLSRVLLTTTLGKMFANELRLKVTKFRRRPSRSRDFLDQPQKTLRFLCDMWVYNGEVIRCSRRCLQGLAAEGIREASLFGERHIIDVLQNLSLMSPVKIARVYRQCGDERNRRGVPLRLAVGSKEKIIVASLLDVARKRDLLREAGIAEERVIELLPDL